MKCDERLDSLPPQEKDAKLYDRVPLRAVNVIIIVVSLVIITAFVFILAGWGAS